MEEKNKDIVKEIEALFVEKIKAKNQTIQKLQNRLDKAEREIARLISEKIEQES